MLGRTWLAGSALLLVSACGSTVAARPGAAVESGTGVTAGADQSGLGSVPAPVATTGTAVPGSAATGPLGRAALGSPSGQTGSPGSAAAPGASGGSAPGAASTGGARNHAPVKVGIVYVNNDAAAGAGINNGNTFSPKAVFQALVKADNAHGGFGGRPVVAVYEEVKSSSPNLPADLQAVCTDLTQDKHVALVVGAVGAYVEAFNACLDKAGLPYVAADYALGDDEALGAVHGFLTAATLTTDTRARNLLGLLTRAGRLTSRDKLGVVVEGCPYNQRTYDRTVVPVAKGLGVPVADHVEALCFHAASDLGSLASQMTNAVVRFRSNGITAVTFVSGGVEGNFMLLFATAAQSQGYLPKYGLTSAAAAVVQEANTPKQQLANASGLGWLPSLDTSAPQPATAASRRCLSDLLSAGLAPQSSTDRYFAFSGCDAFGLYDAVLTRTAGATALPTVVASAGQLGTSLPTAATYGGTSDFGGGRRAAVAQARLFAWSGGCSCFTYTGDPFALS